MSVGNVDTGMRMNFWPFMKEPKKKSLKSAMMNLAPFDASEIVLFSMICVSNNEAAGDDGSSM